MKAVVNKETCIGCGLCVDACPDVFEMDDNLAKVIVEEVPESVQKACQEAADNCPVEAITLQ